MSACPCGRVSVSFSASAAMFVCFRSCVSVDLVMPVDEWEFMCVPPSGFPVHACVLPTHVYLYPQHHPCRCCKVESVLRETLCESVSFFPFFPGNTPHGSASLICCRRRSPVSGGRIPGSRTVRLQGGIEPGGLLQHILFLCAC